jgi:pimeloyl-ACP methyl ester carboxylesterase
MTGVPTLQCFKSLVFNVCWFVICSAAAYAQGYPQPSNPAATMPSETDPRITNFNQPHMSWLPQGRARNQLLVFLPGTGGQPRAHFPFAATAAALGYHVIFLMYPDTVAAQQVCPGSPDPDAYMKFRLGIIRGGDIEGMGSISAVDSIENRLTQLVRYLSRSQAKLGWNQFLDSRNEIDWSRVVISGHSQGGGHAYVVSKYHPVARVVMFGSPKDYSFYFRRPAQGFDGNTRTPLNRYFAFNNLNDTAGNCNHEMQMEILEQIGLTKFGSTNADRSQNFNHAHLLFTEFQAPTQKENHTSVINGSAPSCVAAWNYMLTEPVQ